MTPEDFEFCLGEPGRADEQDEVEIYFVRLGKIVAFDRRTLYHGAYTRLRLDIFKVSSLSPDFVIFAGYTANIYTTQQ